MIDPGTASLPLSHLAFRNWDGTYRNLAGAALSPSDFKKLASRGIAGPELCKGGLWGFL